MRVKKIRGHKRRWKSINRWVIRNKNLNLKYLQEYKRDYVRIRVHPWSGITLINSYVPAPNGITKVKILDGLIEIYDTWNAQLKTLNEPYYLKIWLFEPRFSKSQVVCALGECLEFYHDTFFNPTEKNEIDHRNYRKLENKISKFNWDFRIDEDHIWDSDLGSPDDYGSLSDFLYCEKRQNKMMKRPHRTTKITISKEETSEFYSFKRGIVWIGGK